MAHTIYSKAGADTAIAAAVAAIPAGSGAYPVQQVTLSGNLAYTLPVDAPTDQVIGVVFTQDGTGGHTVTYGGDPVAVDTTAGASTLVEIWPNGEAVVIGAPVAPGSVAWADVTDKPATYAPTAHKASHATGGTDALTPADIGAQPAGSYVPTTRTVAGKALSSDITLTPADVGAATAAQGAKADTASQPGHTQASSTITDLTEAVQDIVGALIVAGTNTTVTYNDAAGTFTINASTGGSTDPEVVRDTIGGALVAGAGIQITVNDAGDTITVTSTAVLPTRQVVAGTGLTGGGDLAADRTLAVDFAASGASSATKAVRADDSRLALAASALQPATGQAINAQTGTTYTLVASDAGKLVTLTNSAAITLTVPGSVFTAGQRVDCLVAGSGMVTAVGSSCTVNGTPSLVSRAQWSAFTVLFTSATTAVIVGDLAAA